MTPSAAALPLFRELGDLKRIFSADRPGSIAERLFARGWSALIVGEPVGDVAHRVCGAAIAAARLGDLDLAKLRELGLGNEAVSVLERAFDEVARPIAEPMRRQLREALAAGAPDYGDVPRFVEQLARQPRAGATCPGQPRIVLQPAENHAEHSLMVALYGVVAASWEGADEAEVFLAGMAHHLHSAAMPDSGYSGEILLGEALDAVIARSRDMALAELAEPLAGEVRGALVPIAGDATAEARAFHTGDVIDRVLELEQHLARSRVTMSTILDDYGLVHDGPVKPLHDRILADAGLA